MILYNPDFYEKNPWPHLFNEVKLTSEHQLSKGGCLLLWGGEDIWPGLYGQRPNSYVYQKQPSRRDLEERRLVHVAIHMSIPIIGICRGAQLICALAGGSLAQHIIGHGRSHSVTLLDEGNAEIRCNSSHHQMMIPPESAKILAVSGATTGLDQFDEEESHEQVNEVVWFPTINALGIQPHPEWPNSPSEFNSYIERKIKEYIL